MKYLDEAFKYFTILYIEYMRRVQGIQVGGTQAQILRRKRIENVKVYIFQKIIHIH